MSFKKMLPKLVRRLPGYQLVKGGIWTGAETTLPSGLHFEATRFNQDDFSLRAIILPLAVSENYIHFTFTKMIGPVRTKGLWKWSAETEELLLGELEAKLVESKPFLAAADSPSSFCEWLRSTGESTNNARQALGYYSIYTGETIEAAALLRGVHDELLEGENLAPWRIKRADEISRLLKLLERDPSEARAFLDDLCAKSRAGLGFLPKAA